MPQQVRSVGAASCAKIFAVLYGIFGIFMGIVFCVIFLLGLLAGGPSDVSPGMQRGPMVFLLGVGSILFFPVFYALIGALGGLIGAALYNFVARHMGGIEIELG